ncbi:ATP synthase F0 subunit C [Candidatus Auribacterota bacterium]
MIEIKDIVTLAAYIGAALSVGFGAIGAGIGIGQTGAEACASISRQPKAQGTIFKSMLIGQAVVESAAIFGLVIAILLIFGNVASDNICMAFAFIGAGISMGFGAISGGLGAGYTSAKTCKELGKRPDITTTLIGNMLIGQAASQTPSIFALVIAMLLVFIKADTVSIVRMAALLGAGISMGFGAIGPGIGSGITSGFACEGMGRDTKNINLLMRTMLVGQAVSQSTAIYAMIISFLLMYLV